MDPKGLTLKTNPAYDILKGATAKKNLKPNKIDTIETDVPVIP